MKNNEIKKENKNKKKLYNKSWNILPKSWSGYSVYKQISCDSGWSTYKRR